MKAAITSIAALAALTNTGNGASVDVSEYIGKADLILSHTTPGGTSPTWDFVLETSEDGSTWVPAHTFPQRTNATAAGILIAEIDADGLRKFARLSRTAGGTSPTITAGLVISGTRRVMP